MVVCRFFLDGRCKYGDRCYNEHPRGNSPAGGGSVGRGVTFRDSFGTANQQNQNPYRWSAASNAGQQQQQQPAQQQGGGLSAHDTVKSLPKEMEIWQNSKMWPFSCFSLDKDIPSLPDFLDLSPEELRLEAYTAMQQGSVDVYKQKISQLLQEYKRKQDQIKAMPQTLQQKLVEMLEEGRRQRAAKGVNQSLMRPSTFGGQTGGNVFGAGAGSSSVFGSSAAAASPSSTSVFGSAANAGSTFGMGGGTTQPSSIFGQTTAATSSVFGGSQAAGGATSTSLFGQSQPATGLFGKSSTPASSAGGSVFGQSAGAGGIFAQSSTGNSAIPPAGLFGKGPTSASGFGQVAGTGSIFGQSSGTGSVFGQAPAPSGSSVFGQTTSAAPAAGLFGCSPSQTSVFGGSMASSSTAPRPAQGLFGAGGAQATGGSGFGSAPAQSQPAVNSSLYTPLADLTDDEKAQFEARTFTPGLIPLRPPPRELINI